MDLVAALRYLGNLLHVAVVSAPEEDCGSLPIAYANDAAAALFGYGSGVAMTGEDLRKLIEFPEDIDPETWSNFQGFRLDGSPITLQANITRASEGKTVYVIALVRDYSDEITQEQDLKEALREARTARQASEKAASQQVSLLLSNLTSLQRSPEVATEPEPPGAWRWLLPAVLMAACLSTIAFAAEVTSAELAEKALLVLAGALAVSFTRFLDDQ